MHAINVSQTGEPNVLELVEVPNPIPGTGEVLVQVAAAGVNFIDTYQRRGIYPRPLPYTPAAKAPGW